MISNLFSRQSATFAVVSRYCEVFLGRHRFLGENFGEITIVFEHEICNTLQHVDMMLV